MSRFIKINGVHTNVDEIKSFHRMRGKSEYLLIKLKNGECIELHDPKCCWEYGDLVGQTVIKQVIPAVEPLYIVSKCKDYNGVMYYGVEKSNYMALCEDGDVYPLTNSLEGYFAVDDDFNDVYEEYAYNLWKKEANMKVIEYFKGE